VLLFRGKDTPYQASKHQDQSHEYAKNQIHSLCAHALKQQTTNKAADCGANTSHGGIEQTLGSGTIS
jgi:hypothetical protein